MPGNLKKNVPSDQSACKTQYSRAKESLVIIWFNILRLRVASVKELVVELVPDSSDIFHKVQKTKGNQFKVKDYLQPHNNYLQ